MIIIAKSSDGNSKVPRSSFTKHQIKLMSDWIDSHIDYPYPTEAEK